MPYQQYQPYGDLTAPGPTPDQVRLQREIAQQLLSPQNQMGMTAANGTLYFSPWQGVGNIARQLMGDIRSGYANRLEQQGRGQYGQQYGNFVAGANQQPFNNAPPQTGSGGAMPFAGNEPRGIRNNNPGNIEDGPFARSLPGYQGSDGRFARFESPQAGEAAMDKLLASYGQRGFDTPSAVINRWAPPSENNSNAYAATVAKALGVDPDTKLDMSNPALRATMAASMAGVENGRPYQMRGPQVAQAGAVDPRLLGAIEANPWASDATKGQLRNYAVPQPTQDVYGQPGVISPQGGARPLQTQPGFQPGYRAPVSAGPGGVTITTPQLPPNSPGQRGVQESVQPAVDAAKNIAQQFKVSGATADQASTDLQTAYNSIPIKQTLRTMRDDIMSHGDKMVWGPTADWLNNLKRGIAQHAPGLLSEEDFKGLASADSFEKLSAQLQTLVGRQAGATDMSLLQGIKSVPGSHNSKEGAIALIDMLDQVAGLNAQFAVENMGRVGQPGFNYLGAKNEFFDKHPIVNPITKNPIRLDLEKKGKPAAAGGGDDWGIVRRGQ